MADSRRVVAAAAIRRIAEHWELTDDETTKLLGIDVSTMRELFDEPEKAAMSDEILKRIGMSIAIWESLVSLFGTDQIGRGWMTRPNADFGNMAPIRWMRSGSFADLTEIREYLDAARRTP